MIDTTVHFAYLALADKSFSNPRTRSGLDEAAIRELALDIGRRGLLVPLIVRPRAGEDESFVIIAGQRRYRAIEWLIASWGFAASKEALELPRDELNLIVGTAKLLTVNVPVRIYGGDLSAVEGVALADNLQRSDLSGYEVAARLSELAGKGVTGRELARMTGKSTSWVSRKLTAWNGAGAELKSAWELGEVAEETVLELAALTHAEQAKVIAGPVPRGRRGAANRPPIEQVKDVLATIEVALNKEQAEFGLDPDHDEYAQGALNALRWVCGANVSKQFAELINKAGG